MEIQHDLQKLQLIINPHEKGLEGSDHHIFMQKSKPQNWQKFAKILIVLSRSTLGDLLDSRLLKIAWIT